MEKLQLPAIKLIGISLKTKTTNANGQSGIDCGNLWQQFEKENLAATIAHKLGNEVYAVYHSYEGDHNQPYSYFIGCKVADNAKVPAGLESMVIPGGTFIKKIAKGEIPYCITAVWNDIWNSDLPRAYKADFEVYGHSSKNWSDAEVDVYLSVQ